MPDQEILSVVSGRVGEGLQTACQALVDLANLRGGHDNITVLMLRILQLPRPLLAASAATAPVPLTQPFGGPKTLVDHDTSPTQVDTPPTLTSDTLESSPTHDLPGPAPAPTPTQPRTTEPHSPTLPGNSHSDTEPGLLQSPFHPASAASGGHFPSEYPTRVSKLSKNGKILLLLAAVFTLLIVGSIVLWWIVRALSDVPPTPSSLLPTRTPPFESDPRT